MTIAHYLRSIGVSQQQFGESLGVAQTTVSAWVRGTRIPSREAAKRIVELSRGEVTFGEIYGFAERKSKE